LKKIIRHHHHDDDGREMAFSNTGDSQQK